MCFRGDCFRCVWLVLFMSNNWVWIEPMHFALKYYSIWIRLNERVNEWVSLSSERGVNFMDDTVQQLKQKQLCFFLFFCVSWWAATNLFCMNFLCLAGDLSFNHSLYLINDTCIIKFGFLPPTDCSYNSRPLRFSSLLCFFDEAVKCTEWCCWCCYLNFPWSPYSIFGSCLWTWKGYFPSIYI